MIRKLLFISGIAILALKTSAQTTFIGGGGDNNWNTPGNWDAGIPSLADDVIIASGQTVEVNVNAQCASLTFADNSVVSQVNLQAAITLTVDGDVNFGRPTANVNQILNVDDGHLICTNIYFQNTGGNGRDAQLWLSDGTVTASGSIRATENNGQRNYIDCSPGGINGFGTINVGGDFYSTDNGNFFDRGSATVNYNGSGNQIIGNFTYHNLSITNTGTKSLLQNIALAINGTFTHTNGILNLNGYRMYFDRAYTIVPGAYSATNMIDFQNGGYLYLRTNSADDFEHTFPLGYGGDYNPLTISNVSNDVGGFLSIYLYNTKHPITSGTNNAITKYVALVHNGLNGTEYDATFTYSDSDIPGSEGDLDEAGFFTSSGWLTSTTNPANLSYNHGSNTVTLTDITSWGDLTLGESSACFDGTIPDHYTVATGNWTSTAIWNGGVVPSAGDDVTILHPVTLNTDVTLGNLDIEASGNLYLNNRNITVQGTTTINGILRDINGTNDLSRTFQGKVTVNTGGTFTCTVDRRTFTFEGGIENHGTFETTNASSNVSINFSTNSQVISGSQMVRLSGNSNIGAGLTLTNRISETSYGLIFNGPVDGADALSTLVNETVLSFQRNSVSFSTNGALDANTAAGNTVQYNSLTNGSQYIIPATYQHLILKDDNGSNNSDKYLSGDVTVNGDFTLEEQTDFIPASFNLVVAGTATIKDRIYDNNTSGTCTFSGHAIIDGARFDGSQNGNILFNGTLEPLTTGFTIDRCNFTLNPMLTIPNGVTVSIIDANGTKTFSDITLESGGSWLNTGNSAITIGGDLTVNAGSTFTQGSQAYTFSGINAEITGTAAALSLTHVTATGTVSNQIPDLTVSGSITATEPGTFTNSDGNTVNAGSLAGTGSFIQGVNSELFISVSTSIDSIRAGALNNLVEYTRANNADVAQGIYYHLTVRNGFSKTLVGDATVNGNFLIESGTYFDPYDENFMVNGTSTIRGIFDDDHTAGTTSLQAVDLSGGQINGGTDGIVNIMGNLTLPDGDGAIGRVVLTVNGTTTVADTRTLAINNNNGSKTFVDKLIIDGPDGGWINTNENIELRNGIEFNGGTFTSGTGTYTFSTSANQAISGSSAMTFTGRVTVGAGVNLTNNNTESTSGVTINNILNGADASATFINEGILNYTSATEPMLTGTLDADAVGNTFVYSNAGNQNIAGVVYNNLTFSNSGSRSLYADFTVNGIFMSSDAVNTYCRSFDATLNGPVSYTTSGIFNTGTNIVTYGSTGDQDVINTTYGGQLVIAGGGIKSLLNDASVTGTIAVNGGTLSLNTHSLTSSNAISVATGAMLDVDENARLLIANNQTLTNNGTLRVVGTVGNEAIVAVNGTGNYFLTQPTAGALLQAQYYQFNNLNNGISITNGSVDPVANFSAGSFSDGIGSQYISISGIDVSGLGSISNTIFNAGPTYNVNRTTGTGAMAFEDATGTLSGENFDNDDGNPGTLVNWSYPGFTYYSNPLGGFSAGTLADWTRNPDGSGGSPASLSDGLATLIVQDNHTVTLDNAGGDIDILALQVGEGGAASAFSIGEDGAQRLLTVRDKVLVNTNGRIDVMSTGSPSHQFLIHGNMENHGVIDLQTTVTNVANLEFHGASTIISGTASPTFNDVTFKAGCVINTSVAFDVNNNIILEDNSVFLDGDLTHTVGGNWIANGTASMTGNGTIDFDGVVNTIENGTAAAFTFHNIRFIGGFGASIQENINITNNFEVDLGTNCNASNYYMNVGGDFRITAGSRFSQTANTLTFNSTSAQTLDLSGDVTFYNLTFSNGGVNAKSITGNFAATNRVTISSGSTVDGAGTYTILGGLRVDGTCNFSGVVNLTGNYLLTYDAGNTLNLGTAVLNIEGAVGLTYGGAATALQANVFNNVNVNSGYLRLYNNTALVGQPGNNLLVNAGNSLLLEGSDNFPAGFGTYNLHVTSRVDYQAGDQTVRGGITYGILRIEGSGTKTVDGSMDVDGELQLYDNTILDLQTFDHTFASNITNEAGGCAINGPNANVTLDAADIAQVVNRGIYTFNNLNVTLSAGSADVTKTFSSGSTININGDFSISNAMGSPSVLHIVNFNDNGIGGIRNNFNLGSYCQFNTINADIGANAFDGFAGKNLDQTSIFYYSRNGAQNLADLSPYGTIAFNGGDKTAGMALDINGDITRFNNQTPVFYDGGFNHTLQGDWLLYSTNWYTSASATGTVTFDGADQDIRGVNFNNIVIDNTGTATVQQNLNVYGDLTVENDATLDVHVRNINFGGNWLIQPSGLFTQTSGTTTFNGTTNQNLTSNSNSYFGGLTINKPNPAGNQTVRVLSELHVNGFFRTTPDAGVFDISNRNAYFGGYFYIYNNTIEPGNPLVTDGSVVTFNGGDAQNIKNYDTDTLKFYNLVLTGAGDKAFDWEQNVPSSQIVDVNGDMTISGSLVSGNGFGDGGVDFTVAGDWNNTGSFVHGTARTVTFDGADQRINPSNFGNVIFANGATKSLQGNLSVLADLNINSGVVLNTNNNDITLAGDWYGDAAGAVFSPGSSTVIFEGNTADIFSGSGAGKSFYNVIVNKNAGQTADMETDLQVDNDLTISSGYLRTQANNITVSGNFVVNGGIFNHNNNLSRLTLNAAGGNKLFDPGPTGTNFRGITINAPLTTYTVQNNFRVNQNQDFILTDGYFDLNGNTLTVSTNNQQLVIDGGTFDVDSGATVSFSNNNQQIAINGGVFRLVGSTASSANLTRTGGSYRVNQTGGTFHAQNYRVELCSGITISGGTIDATNDFSNGTFSNGFGNAYLTLTGLDFADFSPQNVLFNSGPTYNVSRTSGTGVVTFVDAFGSLAGENYDDDDADPGSLVEWDFPTGFFWDGGDAIDNEDWNKPDNWTGNVVPNNTNLVILNHDFVSGPYTVRIDSANADAFRLVMDEQGTGDAIDVILENGHDLSINENLYIGANTSLTQSDNTNLISVAQNFINDGVLNHGNSTVLFNGSAGGYSIETGGTGAGKSFYNLTINATDATYSLSNALDVDNNLTVVDGTFDLATNTNDITVGGNWMLDLINGATFTHANADVTFDGVNQSISGGSFYNFYTANIGTKQLQTNIDVDNDMFIAASTTLDAQDYSIYVGDDWTNNGTFTQTGLGSVTFDGTQWQNVDNGAVATDFNYLIFSNNGNKVMRNASNINADLIVNAGSGYLDLDTHILTGIGGANSFILNGTMYVRGVNNFPSGFETISLANNSWVDYLGVIDQTVYATAYGNVRLRSSGATTTKTAAGHLTLLGTLDMDNDAQTTLDMDANTANLTIAGNILAVGDDITWGTSTSTLIHNGGNWAIDSDLATFNNMILTGTGIKWMNGDLSVTGDITVQNGIQLRMYRNNNPDFPHTMTGLPTKTFTLENGARCYNSLPSSTGSAAPAGFGFYNLADNSNYYLNSGSGADQELFTGSGISYGNLYFSNAKNVTSDGLATLDVNGIFDMNTATYLDNGQDMNLAGSYIYFTNYTPSASTVTVTLDGSADQRISDDINNQVNVGTLICAGSATKTLCDGNDNISISGDFTVNNNVDASCTENMFFSGSNWNNYGTFRHTAQTITFAGTGVQNINPGAEDPQTYFYNVLFDNPTSVIFNTEGADINRTFTINQGTVDLGGLSHTIAGTITNTAGGVLTSNLATITLDGGDQNVNTPNLSCTEMNIAGNGRKRLFSDWTISGDLTINTGVQLNTSDNVTSDTHNISLGGHWTNSGTFVDNASTVTFNGSLAATNIASGGSNFFNTIFNPGSSVTYTLTSPTTRIAREMYIYPDATLTLNSNTLILGSNRTSGKDYTVDGILDVDALSSLRFNNQGSQSVMNVSGLLQIVGNGSSELATLSREVAGIAGSETQINILSGGTLAAQNYLIEYLQDDGLIMQAGSILDAGNNLSNGTWSNIRNATGACYINLECDYAGGIITDVTFNYSGTPVQSRHYNVRRNAAATPIQFENISGNLGSFLYEDDDEALPASLTGLLQWPDVTESNWTGAINSDWHNPGNWDNGVPTPLVDAIIPNRSNDPRIYNTDAECKNLTITDGVLILENDRNLDVYSDVSIGTGTNVGFFTVSTSNSVITVGGFWTRGTNGIFNHGNGTVVFNSSAGSATVLPRTSNFYRVQFNNVLTTFYLSGANITIENDLEILSGTLTPASNNYTYNIEGDFINSGGTFTPTAGGVTNGTVVFNGTGDQTITGGTFHRLTIDGTGNKITEGTTTIANQTTINSTLTANTGSNIAFNGNVLINVSGTFNDGDETHTFSGANWTGDGAYAGSGTIEFIRTSSNQNIYGGTFNNLDANCTSESLDLFGDVTINNSIIIRTGVADMDLNTHQLNNPSGTGTFTMESGTRLYVSGSNNFPSNFNTYTIDPNTRVYYNGTMNQVMGAVSYGNVYLYNENIKTLSGDILIDGDLFFYSGPTLDVTANNYNIEITGHWDNDNSAGVFLPHEGEVEFSGRDDNQGIRIGTLATNEFYDLTANNSGGYQVVASSLVTYTVRNDLRVLNGRFNGNGRTLYVGGDLLATGSGTFRTNSHYILNSNGSGTHQVGTNGSTLLHLTIDSPGGATYEAQDSISLNGDFRLNAGTFNGNGKTISLGNGTADIITIAGTYQIGPGGALAIGNGTSLTLDALGTLEAVGTPDNIVTITRNNSGGRYNFTIHGSIAARYYMFEFMSSNGINLSSSATIHATHNFSDGTFTSGANTGQLFRVENTQSFTGGSRIDNVTFPVYPGGSAANVTKNTAGSGNLEFYNATGAFAGETYDLDPSNLIDWTGPITLTWNGSVSTDWNDANNWTASSGPGFVPTGAEDVIIAAAVNQPILTTFGARTANLTINNGATIIINTPAGGAASDLDVDGDINIQGTLRLMSTADYINVEGNWTKTGTVVLNGNVTFDGSGGAKIINNGNVAFHNLTIAGSSRYQLARNTTINGNLVINSGATLDVTPADYALTLRGNYINNGTFYAQDGTVIFSATSGTRTIYAGVSAFNDLDINAAGVTYRLTSNITVNSDMDILAGTFDANGRTVTMGDGVFSDYLNISGTFILDENSVLRMGNNAGVNVNSGGTMDVIGTDAANIATVTHRNTGNYAFDVNSGGAIRAQYYLFEYMGPNGIHIHAGASVGSSNDFSNGTFQNGYSTGTSLRMDHFVPVAEYIDNVIFNTGSQYNVTRTTGTNEIYFTDASGPLGTYMYELDDMGSPDAGNGLLRWSYVNTNIWDGDQGDNNWHNPDNWTNGTVPDLTKNAIIPNVTFDPIVSASTAQAKRILLETGATLTINRDITIAEELYYKGDVTANGNPVISVGDHWTSSAGTFTAGNSRVVLTAPSGSRDITIGSDSFYDLEINTGGSYQLNNNLSVENDVIITSGTLNSNNYDITVSGGWSNAGNFVEGLRTVTFNASSGTHDIHPGGDSFYQLIFNSGNGSGSATFRLQDVIDVSDDLTIQRGTLDLSSDGGSTSHNLNIDNRFSNSGGILLGRNARIEVGENWLITGTGAFTCGTSTVELISDGGTRTINPGNSSFYNLTTNGVSIFRISANTVVENDLTIQNGILDVASLPSYDLTVGGDWTNLGSFNERRGTVTFNGVNQNITNAAGELFYDLSLSNTSLTLVTGNVDVSNTLEMISGNIRTGLNRLTLGTSTVNIGTFTYTSGTITGAFERWVNALGTDYIFPVGTDADNNMATLRFLGGLTSGSVLFEFLEAAPGATGLPVNDAGFSVNNIFPDGYWRATAQNSFACSNYNLILNGSGFTGTYTIDSGTRIIKRISGGSWIIDGSHAAAVNPICYRNGLNGISASGTEFALGLRDCLGGSISHANTTVCAGDDADAFSNTESPSGGSGGYTYTWQFTTVLTAVAGDANWSDIAGSNTLNYDPGALTQTGLFIRKADAASGCVGSQYSNLIQITVNRVPRPGAMQHIDNAWGE